MEKSLEKTVYNKCYDFAVAAHKWQVDKAGVNYIHHPFTVVEIFDNKFKHLLTKEELFIGTCVALLHDVLEDSGFTQKDMYEFGIPFEIVSRCQVITRCENESYMDFIRRCGDEKIVRYVKMADLLHNMDITRLDKLTNNDFDRLKKYHKAYKYLDNLTQ
jgi:(p)ppGpp synthase/HD superfamily hydrolase